jgi:hypothetical protein
VDGNYDFEGVLRASEHSGFNFEEKAAIISVIGDFGVPYMADDVNKPDWQNFKIRVQVSTQRVHCDQKYEKFINYLQLESEKSIMEYEMIVGGKED